MHKLESVLWNETLKILLDFEIQMDYQTTTRRPNLVLINKKTPTCRLVDFAVPTNDRAKVKERGKEK